ncbi:hypothetical protein R9X47_24140 [Wukongibacter baidiensis]|uniref:hypothetical protein n=1 Tax=Wukongibacter baidiensis TaxID=1723361 RepID=UPI003D7F7129
MSGIIKEIMLSILGIILFGLGVYLLNGKGFLLGIIILVATLFLIFYIKLHRSMRIVQKRANTTPKKAAKI